MSDAPDTAEPAEKLPFVRGVKLAAMQPHRLGTISMAGVTLAAQIAKQADDAKFRRCRGCLSPELDRFKSVHRNPPLVIARSPRLPRSRLRDEAIQGGLARVAGRCPVGVDGP